MWGVGGAYNACLWRDEGGEAFSNLSVFAIVIITHLLLFVIWPLIFLISCWCDLLGVAERFAKQFIIIIIIICLFFVAL